MIASCKVGANENASTCTARGLLSLGLHVPPLNQSMGCSPSAQLTAAEAAHGAHLTTRYLDGMTSERVDKQGVRNIAQAAKQHLKFKTRRESFEVLPMRTTADLQQWQQLDDPIMGELLLGSGPLLLHALSQLVWH